MRLKREALLETQKMIPAHIQRGWTAFGAIGTIIAAGVGALAFEGLMRLIPIGANVATPWVLVSLFSLPLAYCVQLLLKIWGLKEQNGLSREEKRRLEKIIKGKARQLTIAIFCYVLFAFIIAILFFLSSSNPALFSPSILITGGFLGISIFSMGLIFSEMEELYAFKAKLANKATKNIKKNELLNRLKKINK